MTKPKVSGPTKPGLEELREKLMHVFTMDCGPGVSLTGVIRDGMAPYYNGDEHRREAVEWIMRQVCKNAVTIMEDHLRSTALPQDVIDLVIAAREIMDEGASPESRAALDKAAEKFAGRVAWEDEPALISSSSSGDTDAKA